MITLADELRGLPVRRPMRAGSKRRLFCVDEGVDVKRELELQKRRAYMREYSKANRERIRAKAKIQRAKHAERIKAAKARWRKENAAHVRAYQARKMREWRRAHPDRARETKRRYQEKNRDAINARRRAAEGKRRAERLALKEAA